MKIKNIIEQVKELTSTDFAEVEKLIDIQDSNPETKKLANSNRRVFDKLNHLFWQIKQETPKQT